MEALPFYNTPVFVYIIVPLLIMIARITDVSIGTMRVIFVSRGYKFFAAAAGFFEVLIWIVAITNIMQHLSSPLYYLAYAAGFAIGNYLGMCIEEKIALGHVMLSIVTKNEMSDLTAFLKEREYGITMLPAKGMYGTVRILMSVIPRNDLEDVIDYIKEVNPQAFYTVEDIRFVNDKSVAFSNLLQKSRKRHKRFRPYRKGK